MPLTGQPNQTPGQIGSQTGKRGMLGLLTEKLATGRAKKRGQLAASNAQTKPGMTQQALTQKRGVTQAGGLNA